MPYYEGPPTNVALGNSTATGNLIGIANVDTTDAATTGTVEEVLATYTLPANALSANGKGVRISAVYVGTGAGNKQVHLRFGGIGGTLISTMAASTTAGAYFAEALVFRSGASAQIALGSASVTGVAPTRTTSTPAQVETGTIDIVATATTATLGQLTFRALLVEFFN